MKKSRLKNGALIMFVMMAVSLLMPFSSYGQGGRTDGFFSSGYESEDRDGDIGVTGGISNDSFNAPLGDGLLVVLMAGIGYVLLKTRKRLFPFMVITAVLIGVTCCKKRAMTPSYVQDFVSITLDVGSTTKIDVNTVNGAVTFVDGDEIIVANNGKYIGKLEYDNGYFVGSIANPSTNDYLHFYNLGNIEVSNLLLGSSTGCTVSITDQINDLPVISYGHSIEKYTTGITSYTAVLENKCALVKFNVTTPSTYLATCIRGMYNTVTVNFADATFTYGMENDGKITIAPGSGERWAILLPQNALALGEDSTAFSGRYKGVRGAVPEIVAGELIGGGVDVMVNTAMRPEGALKGLFTVNSEGKQVAFSRSNLSYVQLSKEWRFLDHQYDVIEADEVSVGKNCSRYSTITLYKWGQTGYNHGAVSYMPYETAGKQLDQNVYGDHFYNLYDLTGKADWGYNVITNGGGTNRQWKTLTGDEWNYIFTGRLDAELKYGRAIIDNQHNGLVVLPDDWPPEYYSWLKPGDKPCDSNTYDLSRWRQMEDMGALFMPYSGHRHGEWSDGTGKYGKVWSSSYATKYNAYGIIFSNTVLNFHATLQRNSGFAVRLVCE